MCGNQISKDSKTYLLLTSNDKKAQETIQRATQEVFQALEEANKFLGNPLQVYINESGCIAPGVVISNLPPNSGAAASGVFGHELSTEYFDKLIEAIESGNENRIVLRQSHIANALIHEHSHRLQNSINCQNPYLDELAPWAIQILHGVVPGDIQYRLLHETNTSHIAAFQFPHDPNEYIMARVNGFRLAQALVKETHPDMTGNALDIIRQIKNLRQEPEQEESIRLIVKLLLDINSESLAEIIQHLARSETVKMIENKTNSGGNIEIYEDSRISLEACTATKFSGDSVTQDVRVRPNLGEKHHRVLDLAKEIANLPYVDMKEGMSLEEYMVRRHIQELELSLPTANSDLEEVIRLSQNNNYNAACNKLFDSKLLTDARYVLYRSDANDNLFLIEQRRKERIQRSYL